MLALKGREDQIRKSELGEVSNKLRRLARELNTLSKARPDYSERMHCAHKELKAMARQLRGVN